jgi:hypothetical protein
MDFRNALRASLLVQGINILCDDRTHQPGSFEFSQGNVSKFGRALKFERRAAGTSGKNVPAPYEMYKGDPIGSSWDQARSL